MRREAAETLALEALIWLAGCEDAFGAFLGASGLSAADVRGRARDAEFLGFVLDFLLSDDPLTRAFVAETGAAPDAPLRARAALPGGDAPFWT